MKITLTCLGLCFFMHIPYLNAQQPADIEYSRIGQKKIRHLLVRNRLHTSDDFQHMEALCSPSAEEAGYSRHVKTFIVKHPLEKVWNGYCTVSPGQSWCGRRVSFGMLFNPAKAPLVYAGDPYQGLKAGQILFIQLKLFKGLFKLAVAHKVSEVDAEHKRIKICYMKNGASEGSQFIRFESTPEGHTRVIHETAYRSTSRFRDQRIYPGIHARVISEFHENVAQSIVETAAED